jgi:hypothetical protein
LPITLFSETATIRVNLDVWFIVLNRVGII